MKGTNEVFTDYEQYLKRYVASNIHSGIWALKANNRLFKI
jgi:hypothetical protein